MNNPYFPGSLPGLEPRTARVIQDLSDRVNYLIGEVDKLRGDFPGSLRGLAKKENPVEGIITIPFFGGNGLIRVNSDGVISSYTNPVITSLDVSLLGAYFTDPVARQTTAVTTEETFSTKTIPPNTLANDGDFMLLFTGFRTAANANTKRFRVYFGSSNLYDSTALVLNNRVALVLGYLYRRSPVILSALVGALSVEGVSLLATQHTDVEGHDFTIPNVLRSTGQNGTASAGDIIQFGFTVIKGNAA